MDPNVSTFGGQLQEFQLVELVQAMGMGGTSGALHLEHEDGRRGVIYFENGALTWCREYDSQTLTLGTILQQLDMVKAQVINENYDRQTKEPLGEPLGQRLLRGNHITQDQLTDALRTQMLWIVREMALWDRGTHTFRTNEAPPARSISYPVEASRVALEIVRYQYEWNDLRQWLTDGMHTQLQMVHEPPPETNLLFSAPVWRVISHVNAFKTPRRIATALYTPEMDVARIIAPLVRDALLYGFVAEHSYSLPAVARSMNTENVGIFTLLSRMEQEWRHRKTLVDQLAALATFINWTMDALDLAWRSNHMVMGDEGLQNLLVREKCATIGSYPLPLVANHIDTDQLTIFLRSIASHGRGVGAAKHQIFTREVQDAYITLSRGLQAVFNAINMRVDSLQDRKYYETAWMALFEEMEETLFR